MEAFVYLSKSAAILSIFYAVYFLLLRKDTLFTAKRHYLISGILAAVVLPAIEFTKTIYMERPTAVISEFTEMIPMVQQTVTQPEAAPINWWNMAAIVYLLGAVVLLLRFSGQLGSLILLLRNSATRKTKKYTYVRVKDDIAPFSFFRFIVFNPKNHSEGELEMILKHEQVHARQWHSIDIMLAHLLLILQWINPLAWLYKKGVEENLEFIADSHTAQRVASKKEYQLALVKASTALPAPALANQFYQSFIKKRILMLNKQHSKKRNVLKASIIFPLLGLFLWSFNVKEVVEYKDPVSEKIMMEEEIFNFSSQSSDGELDAIETYYQNNHPEALVQIGDRKRNGEGLLTSFTFQTKFAGNDRFYTRFAVRPNEERPISNFQLSMEEGPIFFLRQPGEKPSYIRITPEDIKFMDSKADLTADTPEEKEAKQLLGPNPLYIVNGEQLRQDELPKGKEIKLDGEIKMYNREEGLQKYGPAGSDGVILMEGKATYVDASTSKEDTSNNRVSNDKPEIRQLITKETQPEVFKALKDKIKEVHGVELRYIDQRNSKGELNNLEFYFYEGGREIGTLGLGLYDPAPVEPATFVYMPNGQKSFWKEANPFRTKKPEKATYGYSKNNIEHINLPEVAAAKKEVEIRISKNTTPEQLDEIKAMLKQKHNIDFKVSKVKRDSEGKITSIDVSYSGEKNSGMFHLEDDEGIEPFYFFVSEDGKSGFWSERHTGQAMEKMAEREVAVARRYQEQARRMEERLAERRERQEEMEEREVEVEERVMAIAERQKERETEMRLRGEVRAAEMKERMEERRREMKEREEELKDRYKERALARSGQRVRVYSGGDEAEIAIAGEAEHAIIIDKDTTDETLATMKQNLAAKGIKFNYKKVRRNANGEITSIKLEVSDKNGNRSSTHVRADDEPIETIVMDIQ